MTDPTPTIQPPSQAVATDAAATGATRRGPSRTGTLASQVIIGAGLALVTALFVFAARTPPPTADARLGRKVELIELIRAQEERAAILAARVDELSAQVARYEVDEDDGVAVAALRSQVDAVAAAAGVTGLTGPGVVATLTDAASSPADGDPNNYVIHEEDLQAVVNALWAGGAEAVTVNGERVLATTAIRCVGNTLLLHGRTHSPPYVVAAIGDHVALRAALDRDPAIERFRLAVGQYGVGFALEDAPVLELPPYEGTAALRVARPAAASGG